MRADAEPQHERFPGDTCTQPMRRLPSSPVIAALGVLLLGGSLPAETGDEYFEKRVRPLLFQHCSQCHGEKLQTAGIDFRNPDTVIGGAVVSGDESSALIRAVRYESAIKMPPGSKLPQEAIETLVDWVRMGAPWPGYEPAEMAEVDFEEEAPQSSHWAFQPISDPPAPDIGESAWVRNDIDRFILARLRQAGLEPAPPAARPALLRRAKFDLQGLPPDKEDVRRFADDNSPDAFGNVVDDFLSSPHYGERWGRHWLDVARYADSTGVDEDHPFGDSWRYRDYVVAAFNDDLPFDQFVREQIAGDLLPAPEGAQLNVRGVVATGFLALGPMALAQRDPIQKKYDVVDEQIDTTSKAFLGLTVACARCHDHKFDPILTSDYYALAGIFASTRTFDDWRRNGSRYHKEPLVAPDAYQRYKQAADALERLERIRRIALQAAKLRYVATGPATRIADHMSASAGDLPENGLDAESIEWFRAYLEPRPSPRKHLAPWREDSADKSAVAGALQTELIQTLQARLTLYEAWVEEALQAARGEGDQELPELPAELPTSLFFGDLFDDGGLFDLDPSDIKDRFAAGDSQRIATLDAEIAQGREALPEEPPMANSVAEGEPVRQRIFRRGQHKNPGPLVSKRFPLVLAGDDQPEAPAGSGRLELASWIASAQNPLTARVIVNRVWLWHFGEGLVRTPNNYGLRGESPTHPQLLDWLARRFVASGWSIKALHRLIMDSATYRMSSAISDEAFRLDPGNRLWSRFERRRLTIEELRDSYLQISGRLDPAIGGNTDLAAGGLVEFDRNNRRIDPDDYTRRSLYLPLMRNKLPNLLGLFDFGDATTANGKRSVTNVAPQALYLMNSDFAQSAANGVASRLNGSGADRVRQAYRSVLARPPSEQESDRALQYVQARPDEEAAWTSLCKVLLASNEFHYIE